MACCCKAGGGRPHKSAVSCLGRCDLPKHHCLEKENVKPGPIPKHMGWLYTAKDAPEHQLRCGWRPGHISCPVLRRIEQHNGLRPSDCGTCPSTCSRNSSFKSCYAPPPNCAPVCPSSTPREQTSTKLPAITPELCDGKPLIRIIRHGGQYNIVTQPSNLNNSPSGPNPFKYFLDTDEENPPGAKYSVEAKFNDYHFDYTSSQASFVLDFTPPEPKCNKPCPRKSVTCIT